MENLYNRIRHLKIIQKLPKKAEIKTAIFSFSKKEKIVFSILTVILVLSTLLILNTINRYFMVSVPIHGGSIREGIIGAPRFINPVLAFSDADQDLVSLVYSGLMRKNADGSLAPDLAEKYEVSEDGLIYTFTLKDDVEFHDGEPVTIDDIIFTINTIKDSIIKSPHKANWDGVAISKLDEKTIEFTLRQPYASFLENTTLGIMPAHLWSDTPVELNTVNIDPIGSGPYMVKKVNKHSSGLIYKYDLVAFKDFALGKPYIDSISLNFYSNEDDLITALENGEIDQISSITPSNADVLKEKGYKIETAVLPRVFGLFFNQTANQLFVDKTIVNAINQAIDKNKIINEVLAGYGIPIDSPIPPSMTQYQKQSDPESTSRQELLEKIEKDLAADGWTKNSEGFLEKTTKKTSTKTSKSATTGGNTNLLEFSISTSNAPELTRAALLIKQDLEDIGMKVEVRTFEVSSLNTDVIRPRSYDVLLFGQIINNESDLFAFWHSSQRKDPGLNVAMYTNANADKILEDAFITINKENRTKKYVQFENEVKKDMPAVFLYTPNFIYIVSPSILGLSIENITFPSNRFSNVHLWYTEKYNVWKIFAK